MKSGWVAAVVAGTLLVGACTDAPKPAAIPHVTGVNEVLIQVGDYSIGAIPDEFVVGPELIVYGDGTAYLSSPTGTRTGHLNESQLQELLRAGEAVPPDAPVGDAAVDAVPLLVVSGTHFWEINDLGVQPLMGYVDDVRSTVAAAAKEPWTPSRWILRPFGGPCTLVGVEPAGPDYFDAPVYPHLLDQYPLGECPQQ